MQQMSTETIISNAYIRQLELTEEKEKLNKIIVTFCDKFKIKQFQVGTVLWLDLAMLSMNIPITTNFSSH